MTDEVDVGARYRFTERLGLFAAWRWWTYRQEGDEDTSLSVDNDYRLKLSGPMVGFLYSF